MKAVVQRVTSSAVVVDGETIGKIGKGYNVLLGVFPDDTKKDAEILAAKIAKLFTLCADIKKGNRPSFTTAAKPDYANELYEYFMEQLKVNGIKKVEHGSFGADMKVEIHNDGPVTMIMDTTIWNKRD